VTLVSHLHSIKNAITVERNGSLAQFGRSDETAFVLFDDGDDTLAHHG
jgi:hypothetical protein